MRLFSELFENRVPVKNKCIIKDKGAGHSSRRPGASYRKLRLESLEERQLLAVCTIDSANDTVVMSAAMIAENSVPSMEAELPLAVSAALSTPTVNYGGDKADTSFDLSVDYIDEAGTYTVQYKKSDELSWTTFSSNSYDTDYTVTGLTAGTAYNFRVKANAYGSYTESGWGTYNGTTGIKLDTPTGLQVDSTTSNSITISWNAVDDAVRYRVYYKYGSYETGKYVDATTYTITGLSTGTSYTITVIALGAQNTYADETATYTNSDRSTPVTVTIKTPLASTVVSFEDKTDTSVKIKWGTVTDAQAYTVEYKLSSAADLNWTSLGSGFTAPALNIAGLNPETTYDFRVKANATDSYNESEWSTVLAVKTGIKLDTPTGLNVDAKTDTSVTFHWTEVENASGYIISYEDLSEVVAQDTSSITLNDLDSDKSYSFYVQAIGEGGKDAVYTASDKSTPLTVNTLIPLATPSLTFYQKSDKSATFINYSVPNGFAYTFEYKLTTETNWTTFVNGYTDTAISVTGLSAGLAYDFRVQAEAHGNYSKSDWGTYSVTTGIALATPTNVISVEADRTMTSVGVSWDPVEHASSYDVYYNIPGGMEYYIHVTSGTSLTIGSLSAGTNYEIKVQAIGTGAENAVYTPSPLSTPITIKTKTKLATPVISNNGVLDISASLTWNAIDHATSYTVEQSLDGTTWNTATATLVKNGSVYTASVTNLTATTAYSFRVTAQSTNSDYVTSDSSNTVTISTSATDTYVVGTVTLAVAHGTYTDPTLFDRTITVSNGKWRVLSSTALQNKGGSMILNGEGASFTDIDGKTTVYSGEATSVNFSGSGVTNDLELKLSSNFTKTVALNQISLILGGIFANNFTDPGIANVKFYLNGDDVTSHNFTANWDQDQQGFGVVYSNNDMTDGTHTITVSVDSNDAEPSEYAAIQFNFIVKPVTVVNGMTISGTQGTDWTWNEITSTFTILKKNVVLTGNSVSDITIIVNEEASVNNNEVIVVGVTSQGGTLQVAADHGLANATLTAGGYSDGVYFYIAKNATLVKEENSYTNTSAKIGQLQIIDDVFFFSGAWNVDVKEGDILGVGSVTLGTSVEFAAGDQFRLSTLEYTVGLSGGGVGWDTEAQKSYAFGIANATTGDNYTGATFTSTSENAFGDDASGTLDGESFFGIFLYGGDWTVNYNDSTVTQKDMTAHLLDGSITATTEAGTEKTWYFSDTTTENGVNASSVDFNFNYTNGKVKGIATYYSTSGYLFTSESVDEIVAPFVLDVQKKTISMDHGSWTVGVLSNESAGITFNVQLFGPAQMATTMKPEKVYSCPTGASFTTLTIVTSAESHAEVDEAVDHYLVGSVFLSCNNGSYPTPTMKENCITVTGGDWFVSGNSEGMVGGTIILGGGAFSDAEGTRISYSGITLPLTFNAMGILDLTTLTVVTTAADTENSSDGVVSLREAISYAKADSLWGNNITFSSNIDWTKEENIICLELALTIDKTLTIDAKTQGVVLQGALTGSPQSIPIMQVVNNDESIDVTLSGLTFRDGLNPRGGAIYNNKNLTVDHCVFTGNKAISGAAIYHAVLDGTTANLTVTNSFFTNNNAMAQGGAVYCVAEKNAVGYATITNSTFSENHAGAAGALYVVNSNNSIMDVLIVNSTLVNNDVSHSDGAILIEGAGTTVTCVDSTIAMNPVGNALLEGGSAVYITGGTFNAVNSILVGSGDSCQSEIYTLDTSVKVNLYYCVYGEALGNGTFNAVDSVAGATFVSTFEEEPQTISVTNEVVLSGDENGITSSNNAVYPPREESIAKLNPDGTLTIRKDSAAALMGTLAGKITNIVPNSGLGDIYYVQDGKWWKIGEESSTCDFDSTDTEYYGLSNGMGVQTTVYTKAQNSDEDGNAVSRVQTTDFFNVGAYAINLEARSVIVTTATDIVNPYDGYISLREAMFYAGTGALGNVITFSKAVDWTDEANTITLSSTYGSLMIDKTITINAGTLDVTIDGNGIDGNGIGSVFVVGENIGSIANPVKLIGLILTGGTGTNSPYDELAGGAVYNAGSLLISDCVITGNSATRGGGLYNIGYLTVYDTTFDANQSGKSGGAIHNSGVMFVDNCVFSSNTSGDNGAGITNFGVNSLPKFLTGAGYDTVFTQIDNSTFNENEAQYGAAINNMGTYGDLSVIINQSTLHGNNASCSGGAIALFANGFSVNVQVYSSTMFGNSATENGGAVSSQLNDTVEGSEVTLSMTNCQLAGNTSYMNGGGAYIVNGSMFSATNTLIVGNSAQNGGGVYLKGEFDSWNSTIVGNIASMSGGGVYFDSSDSEYKFNLYNSILTNNRAASGNGDYFSTGTEGIVLADSNLSSWDFGSESRNLVYTQGDHLFVFQLPENAGSSASAAWLNWNPTLDARAVAIDSGNNDYLAVDNRTDYLEKPRLVNAIVDRGAAEWQRHEFAFNEDSPTTSLEVSDAKAGTVIAEFAAKDFALPVYSFTVDGEDSNDFVLDLKSETLSLKADATISTVYKNIVITVMETNGTCIMSLPAFTLIIADKIIDAPDSSIFTIECDGTDTTDQVTITSENGQIAQFDRNGGILVISGSMTQQDIFNVTNDALKNMKLIDINSINNSNISNRDILNIDGRDGNNNITISDDQGSNGAGLIEQDQAASIRFNGIKNVFFSGSSAGGDTYHIDSLAVNFNIRNTSGATLDLSQADITLGGVILDAGSLYHQSILVGQQGTLRIENSASVTNIVLPNGTNEVKGNKGDDATTIISGGGVESYNVISLYGGSNEVTLSGQTKLTAYESTSENTITITDGNGSTINMSATRGNNVVNTIEITGDRVGIYGGQETTETTTVHGNHSMIVLDKAATADVTIVGDSNKIITGTGNDTIHYQGSYGYVSTGDGNDTIIITGENSTNNTFNTGTGTNSVDAMATGSNTANTYYLTNSDILLGRKSKDIVYRGSAPVTALLLQESLVAESELPKTVIESSNSTLLTLFEDDDFENTLDILSESLVEQSLTGQVYDEFLEPFESLEEELLLVPELEVL